MVRNLGFGRFSSHAARFGGLLAVAACLLTGCQGGPRVNGYIEQMAAERRALEDRVYQLEYDLDVVQSELEHARTENDRLRKGESPSSSSSGSSNGTTPRTPPPRRTPTRTPPSNGSAARGGIPDEGLLKPPVIEPGDVDNAPEPPSPPPRSAPPAERPAAPSTKLNVGRSNTPPAALPPPAANEEEQEQPLNPPAEIEIEEPAAPTNSRTMLEPPLAPTSAISEDIKESREPEPNDEPDAPLASVKLLAEPTGGVELDDKEGDDGITVAFQLRDERGRLVRLPGPVSVVVLDLAQKGEGARVARWDLDAEQVARLLPDGPTSEGLVLHMAWPKDPPKREQLQLHIRYVTPDGRKLEDHRDITIRLPGQRVSAKRSEERGVVQAGGWRPKTPGTVDSAVVPASAESPLPNAARRSR